MKRLNTNQSESGYQHTGHREPIYNVDIIASLNYFYIILSS